MGPINFRRIAPAGLAAVVLFVAPSAKAGSVTVDLGIVANNVGVNALIHNVEFPSGSASYVYYQLLFNPSVDLGMTFDDGVTLAEQLAIYLGPSYGGELDYNFLGLPGGASGSYAQNGDPDPFGSGTPGVLSFTATVQNGQSCSGSNSVGSTVDLDPTLAATTYAAILGCDALSIPNNLFPTSSTQTIDLPPLGTITNGGTTTTYLGEETDTEWQSSGLFGQVSSVSSVPEPSTLWLGAAGIAALCAIRVRKRSNQN